MSERERTGTEVAVVGLAGRFPGAADVAAFWENVRRGVESVRRFARAELQPSPLLPPETWDRPDFVPAGAVLDTALVDGMDQELFGFSPREARLADPQQRVLLECAFNALEDAGYDPQHYPGRIALYAGVGNSSHQLALLGQAQREPAVLFEALGSASAESAAMRLAYKLKLRGESMTVYTACSTGLVVVHLACQSLLLRQADVALAAAARIDSPQRTGYLHQEGMIFSRDGHCRPFDHAADGTVVGNGVGVVVLKRLADALRDGDQIYAVILGSALNNDGDLKVGYTAPSVEGQADVVSQALAYAEVSPDTIGYLEAHGTGTPLGDPIELAALTRAFRRGTSRRGFCALGSVKANVGHLDTAAGMAGFIKTVLALRHGELPPAINFERANPALRLDESPFVVNTELRPWAPAPVPRRAGVSSFGIGGTNAHVVLEEAPPFESEPSRRSWQVVALSARTPSALQTMARELADHLEAHPEQNLADAAFTRNHGRRAFAYRRTLVARERGDLVADLRRDVVGHQVDEPAANRVALLFPGQGAPCAGMGEELYRTEPVFRRELDVCAEALRPALAVDIRTVLYGESEDGAEHLASPSVALPCVFALEYALAGLWANWGIEGAAACGHSYGEYAAACFSGVLSLDDALRAAVLRGRLMSRLPPGAMLAVGLSEEELVPLLPAAVALAAVNARDRCTVSGPVDAIDAFERVLARRGVGALRLPARYAFHSADVEPLIPELVDGLRALTLRPPQRPYVSSLTGTWIRDEQATSPEYWGQQMRQPVRFAAGLETLARDGFALFVEAGPDQALTALVKAHLGGADGVRAVPSLRRAETRGSDAAVMLRSLGDLWSAGHAVDWTGYYAGEPRRRVSLPPYPFERKPCRLDVEWTLPAAAPAMAPTGEAAAPVHATSVETDPALPRGETERKIAEIWCERLGVAQIRRDDNFLELGGNSLMAAQVLTRLREAFVVAVPLSDLFEAPTVAGIAARIDERLRLHRDGARETASADAELSVSPQPRDGALPLSVVQARVLAIARREPDNPALNMPVAIRLAGALDLAALERALHEIVRRHEVLRTTYREAVDGTAATVAPTLSIPLPMTDLSRHADARAEALERAREEAASPFDLADIVLRASVLRLEQEEHWLLLTIHHVACDTWSLLAFVRELAALYAAFREGQPSPLPELLVQYADFAGWQERAIRSGAFERQHAWWWSHVPPGPAALDLPTDRPHAASTGFRGARTRFRFPLALTRAVHVFGERQQVTPFMTVLAAYAALLSRHSGQDAVTVGTPIGNRSRGELEPLIGYVAHSVALRVDLADDPSFADLVARVKQATLAAYANPDVPYEALLREAGVALAESRLFDAVFVLQGTFVVPQVPGLEFELVEVPDAPAQWGATLSHLSITMGEDAQGLYGSLEYNPDLFDPDTAERLLARLQRLLEEGLARPERRCSVLPLAAPDEERALAERVLPAISHAAGRAGSLQFSLSYFANDEDRLGGSKYALLLEGARLADRHGFAAVWTPERHFHPFGGLYPSPAVVGAGLATVTQRIRICAGSVVLPLHDPIRVAEEWAVLDNLSGGRVGISFASGWHARDFVFAPERYDRRKQVMLEGIAAVRALWRGEALRRRAGDGAEIEIRLRPRPIQRELPFWLTAAGSPETFRSAGELGAGVLTNLMGQTLESLGDKISLYRRAWSEAGHAARGHVTLMLHAFLGDDVDAVRELVREPLLRYFRSSVDIFAGFAASQGLHVDVHALSDADVTALVEHGVDRYVETAGVFGTPESCAPVLGQLRALDVDEVACLIDFGLDVETTLGSVERLASVRERWSAPPASISVAPPPVAVVDTSGRPVPWGVVGRLASTGERARLRRDGAVEQLAARPIAAMPPPPRRAARGSREVPIGRVPRDGELPLSFAQQRLWYLDQLEPGNVAYNNPIALRLSGALDAAALERAVDEVVRRHDVLRTRLVSREGRPAQEVLPALRVPVPLLDLSGVPAGEKQAEVLSRARAEARRPFALDTAPLMRASLLRTAPQEHVLLLTMHHIVSDGWSAGVLFNELGALYAAFTSGRLSPLPELSIQYADYAVWQRERLRGELLDGELSYWKERLTGLPALQLPTDRPRPRSQTYAGAREPVALTASLTRALASLAREEGATPFMGLLAILQALLHRYTGQEDFGIGTPVAGRNRPEVEPLVGCFVNTLVLRAGLGGRPSFRELLRRVRADAIGAFAHQELPFERLVDALDVPRDLGVPPLFQVMLVLHNTPAPRADLMGVRLEGVEIDPGTAKFDLVLEVRETEGELRGAFEYSTDVFDAATIGRLSRHLQILLAAALAQPDEPVDALAVVHDDERRRVMVEWNDTAGPDRGERRVHELFAEQAARTPEAVAIASPHEGVALTYGDLHRRSQALAARLRALGVGDETRVGLLFERSIDLVVATIATLEAGGAYVPLDPEYPRERLALLMQDAGVRVLVARRALLDRLPPHDARVLCADEWDSAPALHAAPGRARADSASLAYIMYTSGSTGRPKGVAVPHRGIVRLVRDSDFVRWIAGDRVLLFAPASFDVSTFELWGPLLSGASIVVHPPGPPSLAELGTFLREQRVTGLCLTTALFHLVAGERLEDLRGLKYLFAGGDVLSPAHVRRVLEEIPDVRLVNSYGPTEATVFTSAHVMRGPADGAAPVPIGRPVGRTRVYVLDGRLHPVPIGVPGELYVGGDGLARGYLDRPAATAGAFVPDPFGPPGARLYRTGDRARWRPQGVLEFVGRRDTQVKIRGFRVEPGEVEHALAEHPHVGDCVVVVREDTSEGKRLVAYVVPRDTSAFDPYELRAFLRERLPEWMLPAVFVAMEALPLTPHGKVDRRALPAPGGRPSMKTAFVAPRTATEEALASTWAEVLGLERVGVHDNFFELGGDSILSIRVIARARDYGLVLTPKQMFERQTVADLAAAAGLAVPVAAEQGVVAGPVPITPIQHWFLEQDLPKPSHFNLSVLLELPGDADHASIEQALHALVAHHDALRLRLRRTPQGWAEEIACVEEGELVRRVDVAGADGGDAAAIRRAMETVQGSLDLERGPIVRAGLIERGDGRAPRLLLVVHHLAIDGVSWRLVLEDFARAFDQLQRGGPVRLPAKTTSFKVWSERLVERAASQEVAAEAAWWDSQLVEHALTIPVDGSGANTEASARRIASVFDEDETRALLFDVHAAYGTSVTDVLLAALALAFERWCGRRTLVVEMESHGREPFVEDVDLSRTVGWFTAQYPLRVELPASEDAGAALVAVKERLRTVPGGGLGYGLLRYLAPGRPLAVGPSPVVSFNYLGQFDLRAAPGGVAVVEGEMGLERAPEGRRSHLVNVDAAVVRGRLRVVWTYSEEAHRPATMQMLAEHFREALRGLIAHCVSPDAGGYTPSDFPDAGVSAEEIDRLLGSLGGDERAR